MPGKDRLIIKVRVKRKITGLSTYTSKQHHGISADILARKRGIGLDKEKRTLQSTTQDNVISDLKTLILRYIIDFFVVEDTSTELHVLYRHAICKGKIHSWE